MKKNLFWTLSLLAIAATWGCDSDNFKVEIKDRSFQQLCEMSGGIYQEPTNDAGEIIARYCECGGVSCEVGVVCLGQGEYCADGAEQCTSEIVGQLSCKNNKDDNIGQIRVCTDLSDGKYGYQNYLGESKDTYNGEGKCQYKCNCTEENKDKLSSFYSDMNDLCREACSNNPDDASIAVSCNGEICGDCVDGDEECRVEIGYTGIYKCENGKWKYKQDCEENFSCQIVDGKSVCGKCKDDETRCENDENNKIGTLKKCMDGDWKDDKSCENASCKFDTGTSKTVCGICINGDTRCSNNILSTCNNGEWTEGVACNGVSCLVNSDDNTSTICGDCANDATRCVEIDGQMTQQKCENGSWGNNVTCDTNSCNETGTECGKCTNGDHRCDSGVLSECVNGNWTNSVLCPNNNSCVETVSVKIDNNGNQICNTCKTDENGKAICKMDGESVVCKKDANGESIPKEGSEGECECECECEQYEYVSTSNECGECANKDKKCMDFDIDSSKVSATITCRNGKWPKDIESELSQEGLFCTAGVDNCESCGQNSCNIDNTSCGVCKNGDTKCEDGIQYKCVSGGWTNPVLCANNASCTPADPDTKSCGECHNEDVRCIVKDITTTEAKKVAITETCINGAWVPDKDSSTGKELECPTSSCDPTGRICGACTNGVKKCIAGVEYSCVDGTWTAKVCTNGNSCNANGTACGVCFNGERNCDDGKLKTCVDGELVDGKECENAVNGGSIIYSCDKNKLETKSDTSISCKSDGTKGTCLNGSIKCKDGNNGNKGGVVSVCVNGQENETACLIDSKSVSCNVTENGCGKCMNGDVCYTNYYDGSWDKYYCSSGEYVWVNRDKKIVANRPLCSFGQTN